MLLLLLNQSSAGPTNFGRMLAQTHGIGLGGDAMYPRNAASPPRIAIGAVLQISDGAVQTSGVDITVRGEGGTEAAGAGTIAYGASGIVYYTPTQAETNFTAFVVIASKAACLPVAQTIVTSASVTAGQVRLEGVTHTGAVIPTVTSVTTNSDMITAAGIRSAVGLASANLDSQLADIPTVSEFNARTLPSASYFDPATDAVNVDRWSGQSVSLDSDNLPVVSVENYYDTSLLSWLPISGRFSTIVTSLNTIDDFIDTEISAIKNVTDLLDSMIESDGAGQFRFDTIAMSMAPSGGGGGGNPWLTDIGTGYTGTQAGKVLMDAKAKTDLITAGNVTYTSMVDPDGEIPGPIFIGDDYKTVHANAFSWTIPAIPGMTAATAVVRFGGVNALLGRAWLVTGTATDLGGGLWRLVCEMDKSVSANLLPGLYDWTVEVSLTGGNEITRIYSDRKVEVRSKPT